ncbi:MAG: hypothetical protein AAFY73_10080 [Pseudomonadota bacterium]
MFFWQEATKEQCQTFYGYVKSYVENRALNWQTFLDHIYAETAGSTGTERPQATKSDRHSFSKGELSRIKVNLIWQWFERNEWGYAARIERAVDMPHPLLRTEVIPFRDMIRIEREKKRARRREANWERLIDNKGQFGAVDIIVSKPSSQPIPELAPPPEIPEFLKAETKKPKQSLTPEQIRGILDSVGDGEEQQSVAPPDRNPKSTVTPRRGDEFHFVFGESTSGPVMALQRVARRNWELLPVSGYDAYLDHSLPFSVLPHDEQGAPSPLVESQSVGMHNFVFVFAPLEVLMNVIEETNSSGIVETSLLDRMASWMHEAPDQWRLLRLNVIFTL